MTKEDILFEMFESIKSHKDRGATECGWRFCYRTSLDYIKYWKEKLEDEGYQVIVVDAMRPDNDITPQFKESIISGKIPRYRFVVKWRKKVKKIVRCEHCGYGMDKNAWDVQPYTIETGVGLWSNVYLCGECHDKLLGTISEFLNRG